MPKNETSEKMPNRKSRNVELWYAENNAEKSYQRFSQFLPKRWNNVRQC